LHHGVRIADSALVSAATLSNRYITDRLPDKAIDLIDEAAARLKMQVDQAGRVGLARPEIVRRKIEQKALKKKVTRAPRAGCKHLRRN
jgi:ATP-dependent Clp protease ATP-binding subunit ClpB